ncbi:hypothetical protein I79_012737 [Cricetulus griseus]|uniref:Uncharacterized protein n=1 Tax=Cricetulus griseus TaxID=10029 RepID=G3HPM2_CRIGR|nr:hypothetical protein I79_012737 [Cricetulus griseus]
MRGRYFLFLFVPSYALSTFLVDLTEPCYHAVSSLPIYKICVTTLTYLTGML